METMLYLFGWYLDNEVSRRQKQQLRVLKNYVGDKGTLLNGSNSNKVTGIKLSSGNGFPECLREAVIANEGEDLSGFCHSDYKFSTFVSRFEDPSYNPLQEYGDSIKELRTKTLKQLQAKESSELQCLPNLEKAKNKKDPNVATARKVAECLRDQFNPKKNARDLTVEQKMKLLTELETIAASGGQTVLSKIRLNWNVVEKIIIDNKNENQVLNKLWKDSQPKRKKTGTGGAAEGRVILGQSSRPNVENPSKRKGQKRRADDSMSRKAEKKRLKETS